MSKQRRTIPQYLGVDPVLDHASGLVDEYIKKLRAASHRLRAVDSEYLAEAQRLRRRYPRSDDTSRTDVARDRQQIWFQIMQGFQSQHDEYVQYLMAIVPPAMKLAQHVSQLITHGTSESIMQIELSLRVAELESAINAAQAQATSPFPYLPLD